MILLAQFWELNKGTAGGRGIGTCFAQIFSKISAKMNIKKCQVISAVSCTVKNCLFLQIIFFFYNPPPFTYQERVLPSLQIRILANSAFCNTPSPRSINHPLPHSINEPQALPMQPLVQGLQYWQRTVHFLQSHWDRPPPPSVDMLYILYLHMFITCYTQREERLRMWQACAVDG